MLLKKRLALRKFVLSKLALSKKGKRWSVEQPLSNRRRIKPSKTD